jgi:hypothetical protein
MNKGNRALARAASAPGMEADDRGFEHRSTHDFHWYCSVRVWGVRVWDGVSAAVWCVPRLLGQLVCVESGQRGHPKSYITPK